MTDQKSPKPALHTVLFFAAVLLGSISPVLAGVTVSLTAPTNNATFLAPANITLSATASANQGFTLSKVEFFHGTTLIGTDTSSPYSINWSNVQAASYSLTAKATAIKKNNPDQTATSSPVNITVTAPNVPPTVSLTSPTEGATFNAPASITLTASASDTDGTITKVEFFHGGTNLIATVTTPPYSVLWSSVPQAAYTLTAVATDNQLASTTSSPVNVTVGPPLPQMYFIHTDHLNTPRLVANAAGQTVWLWSHAEPFGNHVPDENPSGLGVFDLALRLPGQYFDKETALHYNFFRDYDPGIGRYVESDPIGLEGGLNVYGYARNDPLSYIDPTGLKVEVRCRTVGDPYNPSFRAGLAATMGGEHCYVVVSCPMMKETTISYLGSIQVAQRGGSHNNDTIYSALGKYRSLPVDSHSDGESTSAIRNCPNCRFEECVVATAELLKYFGHRIADYSIWGPNSNSFTRRLVESCGGTVFGSGPLTGWRDASRVGF